LWDLEDKLCEILAKADVKCQQVARLTYGGLREFVFNLEDWETFRPPVGYWLSKFAEDYEADVSEHEDWEFYEDYIRPARWEWLAMADQSVIPSLCESGSDPEKEHALEFFFRGPAEGLRALEKQLMAEGMELKATEEADTTMLVKRMPLDERIIQRSRANAEAAEALGVEYDGWGSMIVS